MSEPNRMEVMWQLELRRAGGSFVTYPNGISALCMNFQEITGFVLYRTLWFLDGRRTRWVPITHRLIEFQRKWRAWHRWRAHRVAWLLQRERGLRQLNPQSYTPVPPLPRGVWWVEGLCKTPLPLLQHPPRIQPASPP